MTARWQLVLTALAISCSPAAAWELPPDNGTMGKETIAAILAGNDYPETSGYRQIIDSSTLQPTARSSRRPS